MKKDKKKLLVLGAGASVGARSQDINCSPPLGANLCQWLRSNIDILLNNNFLIEYYQILRDAKEILHNSPEENYEKLIQSLGIQNRDSREVLHRLLQIMFCDLSSIKYCNIDLGFNEHVDLYDELIQRLKIDNSWNIISLNYDVLFEQALIRNNIDFVHRFFSQSFQDKQEKLDKLIIYKPHGSINYFSQPSQSIKYGLDNNYSSSADFELNDYTFHGEDTELRVVPEYPIIYSVPEDSVNILSRTTNCSIEAPIMANYTEGKYVDTNEKTLNKVREEAIEISQNANKIFIIGVRPLFDKKDDPFVANFFKCLAEGNQIINYITLSQTDIITIKSKITASRLQIYENGMFNLLESLKAK